MTPETEPALILYPSVIFQRFTGTANNVGVAF
jgi:hypothetical protein